jgi:hypothetical protein
LTILWETPRQAILDRALHGRLRAALTVALAWADFKRSEAAPGAEITATDGGSIRCDAPRKSAQRVRK